MGGGEGEGEEGAGAVWSGGAGDAVVVASAGLEAGDVEPGGVVGVWGGCRRRGGLGELVWA